MIEKATLHIFSKYKKSTSHISPGFPLNNTSLTIPFIGSAATFSCSAPTFLLSHSVQTFSGSATFPAANFPDFTTFFFNSAPTFLGLSTFFTPCRFLLARRGGDSSWLGGDFFSALCRLFLALRLFLTQRQLFLQY